MYEGLALRLQYIVCWKKVMYSCCDQSDELTSSNAMEKVAFVRGFTKLKQKGIIVGSFMSGLWKLPY